MHIEYEKHGYVHVKVYVPLVQSGEAIQLLGDETCKTLEDQIEIF